MEINSIMKAKVCALECLESWMNVIGSFEEISSMLPSILLLMQNEATFESSVNVVSESILKIKNNPSEIVFDSFLNVFTTGWIFEQTKLSIIQENEMFAKKISQIFADFGEISVSLLVKNILRDDVRVFFELVLSLTGFPGVFGVDQLVSDIFCEFWEEIQLIYSESIPRSYLNAQIPIEEPDLVTDPVSGLPVFLKEISQSDRKNILASKSLTPAGDESNISERVQAIKIVYARLVDVIRGKSEKVCEDGNFRGWSEEERDKHLTMRRQFSDGLQCAYLVLSDALMNHLVNTAEQQIKQLLANYKPT
ncbi:hypothetical protein HK096_009567, partial [Nowakowskiella sp. JEL0078]